MEVGQDMKILILGGYGVFGGRLIELLSDLPQLEILVSGRSAAKAQRFINQCNSQSTLTPLAQDRANIAPALAKQKPDLVVDASGPFQTYGQAPYGVVSACIEAGIDYLDLADGTDFVAAISRLDAAAKDAGVFAIAGLSTFPTLTAAVAAQFSRTATPTQLRTGIAPSPYAGVGLNVLRAVFGYAGAPVAVKQAGNWESRPALADTMNYRVAVPGKRPLRRLPYSLTDVPDNRLLTRSFPALEAMWAGVGPTPVVLHRMLNALARLRAKGLLPSLSWLTRPCHWLLNSLILGEDRGGMFVHMHGEQEGRAVERSWHLLAEGAAGPRIPSMAAEAIIRKLLKGQRPLPGARPSMGEVSLDDYQALFDKYGIHTGWRTHHPPQESLFQGHMERAFQRLDAPLRRFHALRAPVEWAGKAKVWPSANPLGWLVARLFGFPRAASQVEVRYRRSGTVDQEHWTRTFGKQTFRSKFFKGKGRNTGLLVERFGPIDVGVALVEDQGCLKVVPVTWALLGVPLPNALVPGDKVRVCGGPQGYHFDIEISAPIIGRIVRYQGYLKSDGESPRPNAENA